MCTLWKSIELFTLGRPDHDTTHVYVRVAGFDAFYDSLEGDNTESFGPQKMLRPSDGVDSVETWAFDMQRLQRASGMVLVKQNATKPAWQKRCTIHQVRKRHIQNNPCNFSIFSGFHSSPVRVAMGQIERGSHPKRASNL